MKVDKCDKQAVNKVVNMAAHTLITFAAGLTMLICGALSLYLTVDFAGAVMTGHFAVGIYSISMGIYLISKSRFVYRPELLLRKAKEASEREV